MDHDECVFVALSGCGALRRSDVNVCATTFEMRLPKCVDASLDECFRACARHVRRKLGRNTAALCNGVLRCVSPAAAENVAAMVQQAAFAGGAHARHPPSSDYVAVLRDIAERASKLSDVQPCKLLEVNERGNAERGRLCGVQVGSAALHVSAKPRAKRLRSFVGGDGVTIDVLVHKRTCPDVAALTALAFAARRIPSPWVSGKNATPKRVAVSAAQLVVRSRVKALWKERCAEHTLQPVAMPLWTALY